MGELDSIFCIERTVLSHRKRGSGSLKLDSMLEQQQGGMQLHCAMLPMENQRSMRQYPVDGMFIMLSRGAHLH